jgi:hypothetical protein
MKKKMKVLGTPHQIWNWLLLFSLIAGLTNAFAVESSPRLELNLNREWKFSLGDFAGAEAANFANEKWNSIGLPHSFSEPYFLSSEFYTGYGSLRWP